MGTAELREAPADGTAARVRERRDTRAPDRDIPAGGPEPADRRAARQGRDAADAGLSGEGRDAPAGIGTGATEHGRVAGSDEPDAARGRSYYRPLWVEEPAKRRRLPDPVRTAAVRAVLIIAVTLIQAMIAFLCTMAGSWLAFPMVISSVVSTVVATWSVLDVWVTRQVWNQRNGVVSMPSSTARALRRERRRARATERTQQRIRRRGGTGQLSHP
ncbi:hypothetical protein StrepF001_03260 [Streptomyces sp. F001]|uniref:hypothetical protein n=1 Tax=Streptomyces sp. F001 TaxID=1510026 RepID=UPI00101E6650|nr:hypothetical protein [Streptomyces sp. F001]RZB20933.1 hypothetical protein StrepF001_03260 [Streptomyces sp. F001]